MRNTLLLLVAALSLLPSAWAQERPNIIFILTDDQAPWALGAAGNTDAHTPNMDRLAHEGARFTNFFVATPVCSPSRVELLTSRYGSEAGITDWISPSPGTKRADESQLGLDPALPTWVRTLRDAGYRTGLVGKWHLGSQDRYHPSLFGYDRFYGFREGGAKALDPELEDDGAVATVEGYTSDLLTDKALDFIRHGAGEGKPFLLSLHHRSPHAPYMPVPEEDWATVKDKSLTLPHPDTPNLDTTRIEKCMREYLASVAGVDRSLGRVMALLDELDIAKNTVVIFTSDHGYNIGHHGILHKGNGAWITTDEKKDVPRPNMWDTSLRTPTLLRWPGKVAPGRVIDQCITNLDWYPTLVAMTGGAVPESAGTHGRSFLPLLLGEDQPWDNTFYGQYAMHHYADADMHMIRTPEWKLVRDFLRTGAGELYDLKNDPEEAHNRIDDPALAAVREKLDVELKSRMEGLRPVERSKGD
ncbi:MAG: sulfatase-like hydrolase/transferase [Candidatus Hydrogenedentes bacterium]|nr:sulfatase-like hydrolase/transferase [Candidatus Hydrogenedentota bacterium]